MVSTSVDNAINILYTFLNIIIFVVLGFYVMYNGYYCVARDSSSDCRLSMYKIGQATLCVLYLVFSIIKAGCFNGFTKIGDLNEDGSGGAKFGIAMVIIESILYLANMLLGAFCIYQVHTEKVILNILVEMSLTLKIWFLILWFNQNKNIFIMKN